MGERLYNFRHDQGYFEAGLARGKQVLLGNAVHEIVAHWFDLEGRFLELERFPMAVDPPTFPGTTIYRTGSGPGYGLDRLAEIVQRGRAFAEDGSDGPWPAKFLHLCWWGCDYFSGLDCSRPDGPVLRYVPDEDDNPDPLRPEAESLAAWLEAWLRGERLWDRVKLQFE